MKDKERKAFRRDPENWMHIAEGVQRFEFPDGAPVRNLITGRRNRRVGCFYSQKMRDHIPAESDGECLCAATLDVHWGAKRYYGQPETLLIAVENSNRAVRYTPDFKVVFGTLVARIEYKRLIDIRPPEPIGDDPRARWLCEKAEKIRQHLRVARDAYRRAGELWILLTDAHLAKIADPSVVGDIVANGGRPIDPDDLGRLLGALRQAPGNGLPMENCERLVRNSNFPRGDVLALVQERIVRIDLRSPINPATLVHLIEEN